MVLGVIVDAWRQLVGALWFLRVVYQRVLNLIARFRGLGAVGAVVVSGNGTPSPYTLVSFLYAK